MKSITNGWLMVMKQMINIYVSKSNEASLDDLLHVRTTIKKYPQFNILEHSGGKYDTELIKKADVIVVITDLKAREPMIVGKGVYSEATTTTSNLTVVYVGNNYVRKLTDARIDDSTNWKKYGHLKVSEDKSTLDDMLQAKLKQERFEKGAMQLANNSTYGTNFHHLIEE